MASARRWKSAGVSARASRACLKEFHVGTPDAQSKNLLIAGENQQAMVTLYKYRG